MNVTCGQKITEAKNSSPVVHDHQRTKLTIRKTVEYVVRIIYRAA